MTTAISPVTVTASRWSGGWDLVLNDDHATSVTHLKDAVTQVRDYLDTVEPAVDHATVPVHVEMELGGLQDDIANAKAASAHAARQQEIAAAEVRRIARELSSKKISADDIATLLDVSRSRAYQLLTTTRGQ
ncbi:antitoxin HicB [Corynebacterium kroppenstedtii]|uniref:antitoxin HicB n=1 Tax=Corynebacterium sp. PCR 32 TaxID=3351342 RepID=UPI0030A518EF